MVCRPCGKGEECAAIKGEGECVERKVNCNTRGEGLKITFGLWIMCTGEECGGFCGVKGKCAEGLICQEDEYLGVLQVGLCWK